MTASARRAPWRVFRRVRRGRQPVCPSNRGRGERSRSRTVPGDPLRIRQGENHARRPGLGPPSRAARPGVRHHADRRRRRQDHDLHRAGAGPRAPGPAGLPRAARAVARPHVRAEGRGDRRRPGERGARERHQPAFHRGLPRHRVGPQPAGRDARQPHPPRQRARHRRAARDLATRHRHERPRAPPRGNRPRRRPGGRAAGDRIRHHAGVGGDGGALPVRRVRRPPPPALAHHRGAEHREARP